MCKKSAAKLGTALQQIQPFDEKGFEDCFNGCHNQFLDAALLTVNQLKKGDVQEICSQIRDRFATNSAIQQQRFLRTVSMGIKTSF